MRMKTLLSASATLGVAGAFPGFILEGFRTGGASPLDALGIVAAYLFFVLPFFFPWMFLSALAGLWLADKAGAAGPGARQAAVAALCAAAAVPWSLLGFALPAWVSAAFWCAVLLGPAQGVFEDPRGEGERVEARRGGTRRLIGSLATRRAA